MSNTRTLCSVITGLLVLGFMVQAQETRGTPGVDYPDYDKIPKTSFSCSEQKYIPGLYADMETRCQAFHYCDEGLQESFLCPPGMTFNQALLACDSWNNSNCSLTTQFYGMNSGPEMENARRNILMILQLRNKSRSRPSIRHSDVYEKITSLYEKQSKSSDLTAADAKVNSNDEIRYEVGSQGVHEDANKGSEESGSELNKDLSGLDGSNLNEELTDISEVQYPGNMEQIFYDPVTEKYYLDHDSSLTANEAPEDAADQFNGFYNYGDFVKRYGLTYNEYVDETKSDSNGRVNNIEEFNEMLTTTEESETEFLRRMLDAERPTKRTRRRPLYAVVQEDDAVGISGIERGVEYPVVGSDIRFETESVLTDSEVHEPEISYEVFQEFQNSNIASEDNPEVPRTSEGFQQDILSEFFSPGINENGFGRFLSEEEQNEESLQNDSHETPDHFSYVESVTPDYYESYSTDYTKVDTDIIGEPESEQEMRNNEENNFYRDESLDSAETVESDDTYMVIPDEYDSALEHDSESDGVAETYDTQSDSADSYGAWMDFLPSYNSPTAYTPVGPYWLPVPPYYQDQYGRQAPLISEDLFNPEMLKAPEYALSGTPNDQAYLYDFDAISPERYLPLDDPRAYAYESPISFPGHVYDYGTEYGYPYASVYGNPYTGHFDNDGSETNVATESSNLNENSDFMNTGNSDYLESEMRSWAQGYSTESSETEEEIQATESSVPIEDFADLYVTSRTDSDSNVMPSEILDAPSDDMKEVETFYLFDFDEELEPDNTDGVSDEDQFGSNELFQAEEPSGRNESEGGTEGVNVSSEFESAEISLQDFDENAKPLHSSEAAKNPRHNDNPVPLSASGTLETLNTPTTQSPRQPRSFDGNINLSRDPSFLINRIYPDSYSQIQDAVVAQSYSAEDGSLQSGMEGEFFQRSGNAGQSRVPKLSEIQKRILSLKQGKFGTLKKYINSAGKKN